MIGHEVRGPLNVLKEQLVSSASPKLNVSDFVSQCRERLQRAVSLVKEALSSSQAGMKQRFDRRAVKGQFQPGDRVLVLLPAPGSALTVRFSGPYVVESKVTDTDDVIHTPERRRKTRLCHVNMLKPFRSRVAGQEPSVAVPVESTPSLPCVAVPVVSTSSLVCASESDGLVVPTDSNHCGRLSISE